MADAPRAQDSLQDLHKEATCPICLDYFKDPVILECGHNFCRACLTQTWEKSANTETSSCPQCLEIVSPKKLTQNWQLTNIVEKVKILSLQEPKTAQDNKRVCEKHQEPLNLFCRDDETLMCVVCDRSEEHEDHTRIPLEMAAHEYKLSMGRCQDDLVKEREKILVYKAETEKEAQDLLKQTKTKMKTALKEITEMLQFLAERELHLRVQMEKLEKQIARKRDEHLVLLSWEESYLESLIREMEDKCQQPPAELLQDARNLLQRFEEKQTSKKPVAFPPELKWKIWKFCDLNSFLADSLFPFRVSLIHGLKLPKAYVTLDPDTVSPWLILSEDQKSVRFGDEPQDLPGIPERFSPQACVLGRVGFSSGRHFWEVFVEGEGDWAVGVARESVRRKGPANISGTDIWFVGKLRGRYQATHSTYGLNLLLIEKIKRVRVCLNCAVPQVAFYDADTGDQIFVSSHIPIYGTTVLPFFYAQEEVHLRISP